MSKNIEEELILEDKNAVFEIRGLKKSYGK
jgi:hypothetical protein